MTTSVKTALRSAAVTVGTGLEMLSAVAHFHYELGRSTRDWWKFYELGRALKSVPFTFKDAVAKSYQSPTVCRVYAEHSVDRNAQCITDAYLALKNRLAPMNATGSDEYPEGDDLEKLEVM